MNSGTAIDAMIIAYVLCRMVSAPSVASVVMSRTGVGSRAAGRLPALMMSTISSTSFWVKLPVMRPLSEIALLHGRGRLQYVVQHDRQLILEIADGHVLAGQAAELRPARRVEGEHDFGRGRFLVDRRPAHRGRRRR